MDDLPKQRTFFLIFLSVNMALHLLFLFHSLSPTSTSFRSEMSHATLLLNAIDVAKKTKLPQQEFKKAPVVPVTKPTNSVAEKVAINESVQPQLSNSSSEQQLLDYVTELTIKIEENKFYPVMSRRLRQTGRVEVTFNVTKIGKIKKVFISRPSPYKLLNEAAYTAVKKVKKFKPLPDYLGVDEYTYTVPLVFTLY